MAASVEDVMVEGLSDVCQFALNDAYPANWYDESLSVSLSVMKCHWSILCGL